MTRPAANAGAPRWTHVLGALASAGTLLWGGVTYFIPPRSAPVAPAAASSSTATVGAPDGAAIATMNGGDVSVGAQPSRSDSVRAVPAVKPAPGKTPSAATTVEVSAPHGVGIGTMNGGSVTVGAPTSK